MKRVMIVDDSASARKLLAGTVEALGFEVVGVAGDGEEALAKFKELIPDLTFLDITMPNRDGRECLGDILSINPSARVVMISSLGSEEVINECLKIGAKGFIQKMEMRDPEKLKQLISTLQ